MDNLIVIENNEIRMSSLEAIDLINQFREEEGNKVEKQHKVLLRDIRDEIKALENAGIEGQHNFVPSTYISSQNKELPCFMLNKAGLMQILNKESAVVRYKTQLYIEKLEKAYNDLEFRIGDKKHQLKCMEMLQDFLPEELKQEKVSYIKANTVVNKCTSNYFGFPKMLKKAEMNDEMLKVREEILDDYLKLFEVLQDNGEVRDALYKKYDKQKLLLESKNENN